MDCLKCGYFMVSRSDRYDYPGSYYSIYPGREYPKAEALGMPHNLRRECDCCGWKIPEMPTGFYFIIGGING